jgi:hypothetical protein
MVGLAALDATLHFDPRILVEGHFTPASNVLVGGAHPTRIKTGKRITRTGPVSIMWESIGMRSRDQEVMPHSGAFRRNASSDLEPADRPGEVAAPLVSFGDLVLLAGVFLVSRAILHRVFSVEVDTWWVNQIHHIPPPLLRTDLWRSVYYLHTQPPLWNLILGAILKLGGESWPYYYLAMSLGLGLVLQFSLFGVMRQLGVSRVLALSSTCVYIMSPQVIAYENLTAYDYLATSLLMLLNALFLLAAQRGVPWGLAAFSTVASVLVLVRSTFHPVILLPWFGLVVLANPSRYRGVLVAATLVALPCAAVLVKNKVVFGKASMSSWLGSQIVYMLQVDPKDPWVLEQVRSGAVSTLVLRKPLDTIDKYPDVDFGTPPSDAPVLTQAKVEGIDNYHHFGYIAISDQYFCDAKVLLARRPSLWFRSFVQAAWTYLKSASVDGCFAYHNRGCIAGYVEFIDRWLLLRTRVGSKEFYPVLALGVVAAMVSGAFLAGWGGDPPFSLGKEQRLLVVFMLGNILLLSFVALALDPRETYRHRTYTDPLSLALLVTVVARLTGSRARRSSAVSPAKG